MRILVLSFYYPPDLSAGSYRAGAIVDALAESPERDLEIDVLTTTPNRYHTYRAADGREAGRDSVEDRRVSVRRFAIAGHRNGLVDQSLSFASFGAQVLRAIRGRRYDVVVATTSRLLTGCLGALVARRTGALLYLDVRDLFVDSLQDLFPRNPGVRILTPLLARLERFAIERASRINLVSPGFRSYCAERFPDRDFACFSNGVDEEFLDYDYAKTSSDGAKVILYAGNVGLGQALDRVVPDAARSLGAGYRFRIIGDGGRSRALAERVRSMELTNVELVSPIDRERLKKEYQRADLLLLHLSSARAMCKVLPSKVFEYAATGKPMVAGVQGFARDFIQRNVENAVLFDPCSPAGLREAVRNTRFEQTDRSEFVCRHGRRRIMRAMARDILETPLRASNADRPGP